ncbi:tetratricopeptide repeat protein [Flavobacteriaceae bacterium F08102]|nr:tetratricopeptide repeat protein [Flavobacteriaceae bacterium F08102]
MKKFYLSCFVCLSLMSFVTHGQSDTSVEKKMLAQSLKFGDDDVAVNSIYAIIAKEGANSTYKDSLAYIYFQGRKFSSCFLVCADILSRDAEKLDILEMQAISLESIGAYDKAAQVYAKLTVKSNNNFHAYKLANLYFILKKYPEAMKAIEKAESLNDTGKVEVTFKINKNYSQQVALLAAIANLKGLIYYEQEQLEEAKKSFQQALDIQGDFVLAKENLEAAIEGKEVKNE